MRGLPWWPGGRLGRQQWSSTAAVGHAEIGRHGGGGSALDDAWRCQKIGQKNTVEMLGKNGGFHHDFLWDLIDGIDGFISFI